MIPFHWARFAYSGMKNNYGMCGNKSLIKGYLLIALVISSCNSKGETVVQNNLPAPGDETLELPLPDMPPQMTDPKERAGYILEHFWDGMDFTDTLRSHNNGFMEQNFVNFINLFPHASEQVLPQVIDKLVEGLATDSTAFSIVTDLVEEYLGDAGSPMRNEDYYIIFLEQLLRMPNLSEGNSVRLEEQLKTVMKNRPGMVAADFSYITRDGKQGKLHKTRSDNMLLVIFYDPACSHCTDILETLNNSPILQKFIDSGNVSVLAIYTEGDRKLWDDTKSAMPRQWTVGIDASDIVDNAIYDLPAMPIIYLLDKNKIVLLKDPTPAILEEYLSSKE